MAPKSGQLKPNHNATLAGALTATGAPTSGHVYTIISAGNAVRGTFSATPPGYTVASRTTSVTMKAA